MLRPGWRFCHFGGEVVGLFVEFAHFGKFALGVCGVAHGLIEAAEAEVSVGLGWIELDGTLERGHRFWIAFLLHQDGAQIDVGDTEIGALLDGFLEVGKRLVEIVFFHGDIPEIGQGLGVVGI